MHGFGLCVSTSLFVCLSGATAIGSTLIDFEQLGNGRYVRIRFGNAIAIDPNEYSSAGFVVEGSAGIFRPEEGSAMEAALLSVGSPLHMFFGRGDQSSEYTIRFNSLASDVSLTALWFAPIVESDGSRIWPLIEALGSDGEVLSRMTLDESLATGVFDDGGSRAYAIGEISFGDGSMVSALHVVNGGGLLIDNLRFTLIPSPPTAAFAGALGVLALRRRR